MSPINKIPPSLTPGIEIPVLYLSLASTYPGTVLLGSTNTSTLPSATAKNVSSNPANVT